MFNLEMVKFIWMYIDLFIYINLQFIYRYKFIDDKCFKLLNFGVVCFVDVVLEN